MLDYARARARFFDFAEPLLFALAAASDSSALPNSIITTVASCAASPPDFESRLPASSAIFCTRLSVAFSSLSSSFQPLSSSYACVRVRCESGREKPPAAAAAVTAVPTSPSAAPTTASFTVAGVPAHASSVICGRPTAL